MFSSPTTVFLALGTNLGNRIANLNAAIDALSPMVKAQDRSPVYETDPWGYINQPAFLNQVLKAKTHLSPGNLLAYLKQIETRLGRVTTVRYGPRLIDLDILFYGTQILDTPLLTIPHPLLHKRAFVLVPLADLAPDLYHPIRGEIVTEMLATVQSTGVRRYLGQN